MGSLLHGIPCNGLEKQYGNEAAVICYMTLLDADAARRDSLTFQIFPASGSKLMMNQEWEKYTGQFQDYVVGQQG